MKYVMPLVLVAMMMFLSTAADAARYQFGNVEDIHFIQDVDVTGSKGEKLYLAYKTSTMFALLPVYITDDGYVLGVSGEDSYYTLTEKQIADLQGSDLLPKPLPSYGLELMDYAFGYLLWLVLAGLVLFYVVRAKLRKPSAA